MNAYLYLTSAISYCIPPANIHHNIYISKFFEKKQYFILLPTDTNL